MKLQKEEIYRKLLHLIALLMPVGIFYLPGLGYSPELPAILLGILLCISLMAEFIRLKHSSIGKIFLLLFGKMMRPKEKNEITGSTYIIGGAFICSLLFRDFPSAAFISLFLFITGDAAAALAGIKFGRTKILDKSIEGCIGCFICCFLCLQLIIPLFHGVLTPWNGSISLIDKVVLALAITLLELVPLKAGKIPINDNLAAPVLGGLFIKYVMPGM